MILDIAGLPEDEAIAILDNLRELGAIELYEAEGMSHLSDTATTDTARPERRSRGASFHTRHRRNDQLQESGNRDRLLQTRTPGRAQPLLNLGRHPTAREHERGRHLGSTSDDALEELGAAHARHHHVADHQIEPLAPLHAFDRRRRVELDRHIGDPPQTSREASSQTWVVVDDEHSRAFGWGCPRRHGRLLTSNWPPPEATRAVDAYSLNKHQRTGMGFY
jgi:hypothetical protein